MSSVFLTARGWMVGLLTRVRDLFAGIARGVRGSSRRSVASVGFVSVAVVGLIVAMFLSDGFRATSYDLQDASVWVTQGKQKLLGRINTQIAAQDATMPTEVDELDVVQDGRSVFVVDSAKKLLKPVAVDQIEFKKPDVPIPKGAQVDLAGDTLVVVAPSGKTWIGSAEAAGSLGVGERKPDLNLGDGGTAAVGRDGQVVAYSALSGDLLVVDGEDRSTSKLGLKGAAVGTVQVSMAKDRPVLLDIEHQELVLPGDVRVDLTSYGTSPELQLPSDDADQVLVSTDQGIVSVPVDGSKPSWVHKGQASSPSRPARPVRIDGCSYAAWGESPVEVVACDNFKVSVTQLDSEELKAPAGVYRFRVNRKHVVLNELETGAAFFFVDGEVKKVDNWEKDRPGADDSDSKPTEEPRPGVLDLAKKNEPPVANDDDKFGARPTHPAILSVLDNDYDPNDDLLVITELSDVPEGLEVRIVNQGQQLQVLASAEALGPFKFSYTIDDGRKEPLSDSAVVSLRITPDGQNAPPQLTESARKKKEEKKAFFKVESGKSAAYDVLQDWWDPDGDPIYLESASIGEPAEPVPTLPTGLLSYNDSGLGTGIKNIQVTVRDAPPVAVAPGSATDDLRVQVEPPLTAIPPVARPDYRSTVVGATVIITPLENDSDGNGDELHISKLIKEGLIDAATTSAEFSSVDDTVSFKADVVGSYVFGYEVTDGTSAATGLIRVDVADESMNRPPSAGRDLVVLPAGANAQQTIDLLANDVDPDGDILVVTKVTAPSPAPFTAQLLEHRRLRVAATGDVSIPHVIKYIVSDGQETDVGEVVVVSSPSNGENKPPVLKGDAVTVRTGDVVNIPVLANDVDPEGAELAVLSKLATEPGPGEGLAFVSGSVVRFIAPDKPMTVRFDYSASDGINTDTARIVVTVGSDSDNASPQTRTVEARVLTGNAVKIAIPLAGIDPDGDSVTLKGLGSVAPTLGRVITPVGHDFIVYEAFKSDIGGTDTFTYKVVDRRGAKAEGMVRVGVAKRQGNTPPQPGKDRVEIKPGEAVRVPALANDYDPDGDALKFGDPALESVPDGLQAEVDGTKIRITAPNEVRQLQPLLYNVTDGRSSNTVGVVEVIIKEDAVGLAPIARDDEVNPPKDPKTATVEVDATANDDDPDGDIADLKVSVVGSPNGVSLSKDRRKLLVDLEAKPRLVPYQITDPQNLTAIAIVRVPALGTTVNRPPAQRSDAPKLKAVDGKPTAIKLADFVEDPEGKPVRITIGSNITATHNNDAGLFVDIYNLSFTSEPGYSGQASITFEVTDGDAGDNGNMVTVSLPIQVFSNSNSNSNSKTEKTNSPPIVDGGVSLSVAPKEDGQKFDLKNVVQDPDPDDKLTFAIKDEAQLPARVTVDRTGSAVTATADAKAKPGAAGKLLATVSDNVNEPQPIKVDITVVQSTRPPATCVQAVIDKADVGKTVSRNVLADCYNPFPDTALKIDNVLVDGTAGTATKTADSIDFSPTKGFVGDAVIRYQVTDAIGRIADGLVSVTVRDVPDKPSPATVVEVASRKVILTWQPPQANGAEIDYYTVKSSHGSTKCETTTCTIDGLQNNTTYNFTVTAHNEVGDSDPSTLSAGARPDQRPEPPTNVVLAFDKELPDGRLKVTWDTAKTEGSPVTAYELQISPPPPSGPATTPLGAVTTYTWTSLANGTSYRVKIRAVNAAATGPSDWSVDSNPDIPAKAPDAPTGVSANRRQDPVGGIIDVTWMAPESDGGAPIAKYTINASVAGNPAIERTSEVSGTELKTYFDKLDPEKDYTFQVLATNKVEEPVASAPSNPMRAPAAPDDISSVTAIDNEGGIGLDQRAKVLFAAPRGRGSNITRYEIQGGGRLEAPSSTTTPVSIVGLSNGAPYTFRIRACNQFYCAKNWATSNAVTPYGRPAAPSQPGWEHSGDTAVTFSWNEPPDNGKAIQGYDIFINSGWVHVVAGRSYGPVEVGWSPGSKTIQVRAYNAPGNTGAASVATTGVGKVKPPPPPVARTIDDSFLGGTWSQTGTQGGDWALKDHRPWWGVTWLANRKGVSVSCVTTGGNYIVKYKNGTQQTWNWYARLDNGNYIRTAVFADANGDDGIRHC